MKFLQSISTYLICVFLLAACASGGAGTAVQTSEVSPTPTVAAPTATKTPIPATLTEAPTLTPEATATATEVAPTLTAEAQAAWDTLNLQTKSEWTAQEIPGWGVGFVRIDKETGEREEIVDFPITFTNGQGQNTTVHQLCYKSQTTGTGTMTVLTCMSQPRDEHRLVKISGTDDQAKKFFNWAINDSAFINGNPQLLAALQSAAKGEKPLVLVQGDLAGVPAEFRKQATDLKIQGMPFGTNISDLAGNVSGIATLPFELGDKNFAVVFDNYEEGMDYGISVGKTEKFVVTDITRWILDLVSKLTSDGNFDNSKDRANTEKTRRLVIAVPEQLKIAGVNVEMAVLR